MIIRGGENIYPREIEEFLYKMPGIKDVQVAGVPSQKYGEAVGAFIILHEGYTMNEFDVREFCQGKIARYKIPKYIFFVKEFPMTGSGKIQKFKLKDLSLKLCAEQGIEIFHIKKRPGILLSQEQIPDRILSTNCVISLQSSPATSCCPNFLSCRMLPISPVPLLWHTIQSRAV